MPPESFRSRDFLDYVADRYLRFQNGDYFLKSGTDSPENFLAYEEFDATVDGDSLISEDADTFLHDYHPHVKDWRDPSVRIRDLD